MGARRHRPARPAVHRTILVVDMDGFGDQHRTNQQQVAARDAMYQALECAFRRAHIPWVDCYREDRGDGALVLAPPEIPKALFVESLPRALVDALHKYNHAQRPGQQIRIRIALHAGEVNYDDHGVTATAITLTFRLVNADPLKEALAEPSATLAIIVSPWFFEEVVRNCTVADLAGYRQVSVTVKETNTSGWISIPTSASMVASLE